MSAARSILPAITCIRCGYTLAGLPASANCPECDTPAAASIKIDPSPPGWLELLTRTILRPHVLWAEPLPLHRAGLRLMVNTHLGMFGFAGAIGTFIGLAAFVGEWRRAGPVVALLAAPIGVFIVAVIAAGITLLTGIFVQFAILVGAHGLSAAIGWFRPVRPSSHQTAVASCALYPMVAGAAVAWLAVALTAAALIVVLAFGGTPQLIKTCGMAGGVMLLVTAAASMLYSVVLAAWGSLDPKAAADAAREVSRSTTSSRGQDQAGPAPEQG